MLISIVAIGLLLMLSAFTSGTETAMTGASPARIHALAAEGDRRAVLVKSLLERKENLIGSLLLGNNAFNILATALAAEVFIRAFGEAGVVYASLVMTLVVVIFAEVLPKTYAIRHPESLSLFIAPAVRVLVWVVTPATWLVQNLVNVVLKLFRVPVKGQFGLSLEALRGAIEYHAEEGGVPKQERDMLGGILDLADVEVGEVMVHRRSMVTIDADMPPQQVVELVTSNPYTRYPVWRGDPDAVIGVLHAKDLLTAVSRNGLEGLDLVTLTSPPWFIPDTTPLRHQLFAFRQRRLHLALVVDEYGALMGLVTLEDILEEIVGEIADESDIVQPGIEPQPDGSVLIEGHVTVRDVNRQLDWRLPDDEAVTIAGLVIHEAQRIPEVGQSFAFHGFRFEVLKRQRNQVTLLRVSPQPAAEAAGPTPE
jgi:Mg2+/Co2+ transporter CorB